jgi:hypothetical protein
VNLRRVDARDRRVTDVVRVGAWVSAAAVVVALT